MGAKAPARQVVKGTAWLVFVGWVWIGGLGNPLHEYELLQRAELARGSVVEIWEGAPGRHGTTALSHGGRYTFRAADGREYSRTFGGRLGPSLLRPPYPVKVVYLPDNPQISRQAESFPTSLTEWLVESLSWRLLALVLFSLPGVFWLRKPSGR